MVQRSLNLIIVLYINYLFPVNIKVKIFIRYREKARDTSSNNIADNLKLMVEMFNLQLTAKLVKFCQFFLFFTPFLHENR